MGGPALGGCLSNWGFHTTCFVSAALSAVNLLVGICLLTESRLPRVNAGDLTVAFDPRACNEESLASRDPMAAERSGGDRDQNQDHPNRPPEALTKKEIQSP